MNDTNDLQLLIGAELARVLERLDEGILVLDRERSLRYLNRKARALLGYGEGEVVGGRCRHSTRGLDCETACPLTFALSRGQRVVERFATVYNGREGQAVALEVTLIPLHEEDGQFRGAVEILRPTAPDPGFYAAGTSDEAQRLRREIGRCAALDGPLIVIGEELACGDVAEAVHRASGLDHSLFFSWNGSWDGLPLWPPGSMYAFGDHAASLLFDSPPPGWRLLIGATVDAEFELDSVADIEVIRLPHLKELLGDLPFMVKDLVGRMKPGLAVTPGALRQLVECTQVEGLQYLHDVLSIAVAAADEHLTEAHLPVMELPSVALNELLESPEPLAAMEHRILQEVLIRSGWRMQEAADRLGISRVTLWRKLKEHGIERSAHDEKR